MAKDDLARGAKSAVFSAGQAQKDEPIEFHGTVALEEAFKGDPEAFCPHGTAMDRVCVLCDRHKIAEALHPEPKSLEELAALYEPLNDRVLLRRITEENKRLIQMPDAFKLESDLGVVIAVGFGVPFPLTMGDKVRVGHYGIEDIEIEGETLMLVSALDVRLRIKA